MDIGQVTRRPLDQYVERPGRGASGLVGHLADLSAGRENGPGPRRPVCQAADEVEAHHEDHRGQGQTEPGSPGAATRAVNGDGDAGEEGGPSVEDVGESDHDLGEPVAREDSAPDLDYGR